MAKSGSSEMVRCQEITLAIATLIVLAIYTLFISSSIRIEGNAAIFTALIAFNALFMSNVRFEVTRLDNILMRVGPEKALKINNEARKIYRNSNIALSAAATSSLICIMIGISAPKVIEMATPKGLLNPEFMLATISTMSIVLIALSATAFTLNYYLRAVELADKEIRDYLSHPGGQ